MSTANEHSTKRTITHWLDWMRKLPPRIEHDGLDPITLAPSARFVLMTIVVHSDKHGRAFPSLRQISRVTGLHRSTVVRSLAALEAAGVIARFKGSPRERLASTYFLQDPPAHPAGRQAAKAFDTIYRDVMAAGGTAADVAEAMAATGIKP